MMTIFNTLISGKYPVMRFCKSLGEDYKIIAEYKNVMFYCVKDKKVEVWFSDKTQPVTINDVDFVNTFRDIDQIKTGQQQPNKNGGLQNDFRDYPLRMFWIALRSDDNIYDRQFSEFF